MSNSLRTPLGRARGMGSAKAGTGHFIGQRVSAIALALLAPYLLICAALTMQPGYDGALAWTRNVFNAAPLLLFIFCALYHMQLGMQVIIEDYIAKHGTRAVLLLLNLFATLALATVSAFAIFSLVFGG